MFCTTEAQDTSTSTQKLMAGEGVDKDTESPMMEEMELPGMDTRRRRFAATHRSIRFWNAYAKSGGVTKSLVARGHFTSRLDRRDFADNRSDTVDTATTFDGNMTDQDGVVYSLNKKQRWRLMDAFQDGVDDVSSDVDVVVCQKDKVRYNSSCTKIMKKAAEAEDIQELEPHGRYLDSESRLKDLSLKEKLKDCGRERRRVKGKRGDGEVIKVTPKVAGHSHRCNCARCNDQSENLVWAASEKEAPAPPTFELRYNLEMPLEKRLVNKRGIVYDSYQKSQNKVVKKSGRSSAYKDILERQDQGINSDAEEEVEELMETESPPRTESPSTLGEWMITPNKKNEKDSLKPFRKVCTQSPDDPKSKIHYVEHTNQQLVADSFEVVASPHNEDQLFSTKVTLDRSSIEPSSLKEMFADMYIEADSIPRSFVIDISDVLKEEVSSANRKLLQNLKDKEPQILEYEQPKCRKQKKASIKSSLKKTKANIYNLPKPTYHQPIPSTSTNALDIQCHVVFTELKIGSSGKVEVSVLVNSNLDSSISYNPSLFETSMTVSELLTSVIQSILVTPDFPENKNLRTMKHNQPKVRIVKGHYQSQIDDKVDNKCLTPKEIGMEVKKMVVSNQNETATRNGNNQPSTEMYCNICLAVIHTTNEKKRGSNSATVLGACEPDQHWFCNTCWYLHLKNQIEIGAMSLTCPEYRCPVNVDLATLYRLLPVKDCNKFLKRLENQMISTKNSKWCPNKDCGCALVIEDAILKYADHHNCIPVSCSCGIILCFNCLAEQHWPASCSAAEKYHQARIKNGQDIPMWDGTYWGEHQSYIAQVKQCPHCNKKMEKGPGCDHMSCTCGKSFCWRCASDFESHYKWDAAAGNREWVGCVASQQDLEKIEIGEETEGLKDWYAKAYHFRKCRRGNYLGFHLNKFVKQLKPMTEPRVSYNKTQDILNQLEQISESRRTLHNTVRKAFDDVITGIQVLEFSTVMIHFRGREADACLTLFANQLRFFTDKLSAILSSDPTTMAAREAEAQMKENSQDIEDAISAIKRNLAR